MKGILLILFIVCVSFWDGSVQSAAPAVPNSVVSEILAMPASADRAVITFYLDGKTKKAEVMDKRWLKSFGSLLGASSLKFHDVCLCTFYPQVEFFKEGTSLGEVSAAGDDRLEIFIATGGGEFFAQKAVVKEIIGMVLEKKSLVPPDRPEIPKSTLPKIQLSP
jgi:hypothetical protein